ncbi:MAG: ABC transporter substrate-binding protein [Candidatus Tectimicrobiota bacterium]
MRSHVRLSSHRHRRFWGALLALAGLLQGSLALAADVVAPRPLPHAPSGGTLTIAYMREPTSPDGFQAVGTFDRMYFYTGNEVLVAMGKDGLYDPSESLAYAYEVLDEGKRYRFHLRQGIQFQGGAGEMSADDVAWGLNRIHQKDSGSRWTAEFRAMDRAVAVDPRTVDVFLKEPDANLIIRMFNRASIVHSRKHWEQVGGATQHKIRPLGTGPYQLTAWQVGIDQKWQKHDAYWRGTPLVDQVVVKVITESRTRLAALQTGEVQVAWLQAEQIPEAKKDPNIKIWSVAGVGWDGWTWAPGLPPMDDLRLRRALVKAIDRKALNKAVYLDTLQAGQGHAFPTESAYGIDAKDLWQGEWLKFDPPAAKKLVQEVARDKKLKLPLELQGVCEQRPDRQLFCEFLQAAWEEIGVKLTFKIVANAAERLAVIEQCQTHINQTGSGTVAPHDMETTLLSSSTGNISTRICHDKGHVLAPDDAKVQAEMDRLLNTATQQTELAKALELYKQVQRLALEKLWIYVPALLRVNYIGCHIPTTGGCDTNPMRADGFIRPGDFWRK